MPDKIDIFIKKFKSIWTKSSLLGKIFIVLMIIFTIGFLRTNLLFFVIAWIVIIFYIVKTVMDLEML
jgi:hypothetical protein